MTVYVQPLGLNYKCGYGSEAYGSSTAPRIALSANSLPENSAAGTVIGTLSTVNTTGTATFTLTDSAGNKIALAGTNNTSVRAGATPADYETTPTFTFAVSCPTTTPPISSTTFTVAVGNVLDVAPVITSNGGGASASVSVAENTTAVTTVTATVAETGATIVYSITGGTDAGKFTIGSSSGVLAFVTPPDFEVPTDSNADNAYVVIVTAANGANTDTQTITVTVTDVGEGGPPGLSFNAAANSQYLVLLEDI